MADLIEITLIYIVNIVNYVIRRKSTVVLKVHFQIRSNKVQRVKFPAEIKLRVYYYTTWLVSFKHVNIWLIKKTKIFIFYKLTYINTGVERKKSIYNHKVLWSKLTNIFQV